MDAEKTISAALPFQNDTTVEKLPGHIVRVTGKLKRDEGHLHRAFRVPEDADEPDAEDQHAVADACCISGAAAARSTRRSIPTSTSSGTTPSPPGRPRSRDLPRSAARYIQIDDVTFPLICDPHGQEALKARGDDPHQIIETYAGVLNRIVAGAPKGVTLGMHMCRGNNRGKWMGSGGYEYVSEVVLRNVDIPNYFMEYDSDRAGDFQPLRHVPKGKHVILGLVSTKTPVLESKDELKRRIDEAAKFLPLDQLCLSPQCGFASNFMGNPVTVDDEQRKLALVVETAREVWG